MAKLYMIPRCGAATHQWSRRYIHTALYSPERAKAIAKEDPNMVVEPDKTHTDKCVITMNVSSLRSSK